MSSQAWAVGQLFKYKLAVDFDEGVINKPGDRDWFFDPDDLFEFYRTLDKAVREIERSMQ